MLTALTLFHVLLSLAGIGAGIAFVRDLLLVRERRGWTNVYLGTTIATSVTGYLFPADHITPAHIVGAISLVALALALKLRGTANWRRTYIVTTLLALYLNVFVLVVQLFLKVEPLKALAPTQTEAPFQIAQGIVLVLFCAVGFRALKAQARRATAIA